jgi:hypothetical protein
VRREEHDVEKARFWRSTIAIPEFPPRTVRTSEIPRPVNTLEKPSPSNSLFEVPFVRSSRGAKTSPLVSTYPILNTPLAALRPSRGFLKSLPILTRISYSLSARVPAVSPQCCAECSAANCRRAAILVRHLVLVFRPGASE